MEEELRKATKFGRINKNDNKDHIPIADSVIEMSKRFGNNRENVLTEWEKSDLRELFREYDKNKSGYLDKDELRKLMMDLMEDKHLIGKVPNLTEEEVNEKFEYFRLIRYLMDGTQIRMGRYRGLSLGKDSITGNGN